MLARLLADLAGIFSDMLLLLFVVAFMALDAVRGSSAEEAFELALRTAVAGWLSASAVAARN